MTLLIPRPSLESGASPTDLEWMVFTDGMPAEETALPLTTEVVAYEPVGSKLMLRVRVRAPGAEGVRTAAVSAVVRRETGPVASAAWASVTDLDPGESAIVVLALPLPAGFDLTTSVVDVWGGGLPASP
ncbi:MAG TPA: hypothetical protein VLL77_03655 [Anaerolineales bacterium]|nr:hypothetical protein [Anaerolineales bacterium]